jgi:hypothetical protein
MLIQTKTCSGIDIFPGCFLFESFAGGISLYLKPIESCQKGKILSEWIHLRQPVMQTGLGQQ